MGFLSFPPDSDSASEIPTGLTLWFALVLATMVVFQVWRLAQTSVAEWLAVDYLMRVVALILLAAMPAVRPIAFKPGMCRIGRPELLAWLVAGGGAIYLTSQASDLLSPVLPYLQLGHYPRTSGVLYFVDLTFGIALVALHEEIFFRRLARAVFDRLGGTLMIAATSTIFGLYHWWTGLANMLSTALLGAFLMLFYRRAGILWPAVLIHYAADFYYFF